MERPGKTGFTASFIVGATQQQSVTQADNGGFESLSLDVVCGSMKAAFSDCLCTLQMFGNDNIFGSGSADA